MLLVVFPGQLVIGDSQVRPAGLSLITGAPTATRPRAEQVEVVSKHVVDVPSVVRSGPVIPVHFSSIVYRFEDGYP